MTFPIAIQVKPIVRSAPGLVIMNFRFAMSGNPKIKGGLTVAFNVSDVIDVMIVGDPVKGSAHAPRSKVVDVLAGTTIPLADPCRIIWFLLPSGPMTSVVAAGLPDPP